MALYRNITAFSRNGEYLAYSSPDGCLKIWETSTCILKQEFTPSSHLSATCSSLTWGPSKQNLHLPKSPKKFRSNASSALQELQLIAIGTMTGDILLYSFAKAELHSVLTNGHTGAVNDLCWYAASNSLFSCSNDQQIIIWDIYSGNIKIKWKADKVPIYSICVVDDNNLLSASTSILWWDVKHKNVIKSFNGHASEINRLLPLHVEDDSSDPYFLSAAIGDRVISVWQLSKNNSKRNVASFVLSGEPVNISVVVKKNEPFRMSAVTKEGSFHLFEHTLNGKTKKPLQPKFTIQVAAKSSDSSTKPHPVPILAASIAKGLDSCVLTYGNFLKPMFESINISEYCADLFLIRDLSYSSAVSIQSSVSRVKQTEKPKNVKMLAPGHMTDFTLSESSSKKRKPKGVDIKELPMEERLKALDLSKIPKNLTEQAPTVKSDSMVHLLLQGLQSNDNNMLNTVLQCGDETIIRNTLERLPIQSLYTVLKEIHRRISKREPRNHACIRWLKYLFALHIPYLISNHSQDVVKSVGPIGQIIEAREENHFKMSRLRGAMKISLSEEAVCPSTYTEITSQPLVEYLSESSDESENSEIDVSEDSADDEVDQVALSEESESSNSESDMED